MEYVSLFPVHERLVNMLTIMIKKLLFQLISVIRELFKEWLKVLFSDSLAEDGVMRLIDEVVSLVECYLESTNYGWFSKSNPIKRRFINFIANVIAALLNEKYLKTLVHFIGNNLPFFKTSHFKNAHHLKHKLVVIFVIKCVERIL